jgi:hypothetical protein
VSVQFARDEKLSSRCPLIDAVKADGFAVKSAIWTRALTSARSTAAAWSAMAPVTAFINSPLVNKRGEPKRSTCEHGTWTFAGADFVGRTTKWALPDPRVQVRVNLGEG